MKHEIIELHDVQIIGMAKKIAFNEAKEECPKFWGEYVEKIIKPVVFEKQAPNAYQNGSFRQWGWRVRPLYLRHSQPQLCYLLGSELWGLLQKYLYLRHWWHI